MPDQRIRGMVPSTPRGSRRTRLAPRVYGLMDLGSKKGLVMDAIRGDGEDVVPSSLVGLGDLRTALDVMRRAGVVDPRLSVHAHPRGPRRGDGRLSRISRTNDGLRKRRQGRLETISAVDGSHWVERDQYLA